MAVRELEQWGVVRRTRSPGDSAWHYVAETDFFGMIGKVVAEREGALVDSVVRDLTRAEALAVERSVDEAELERVQRMRRLAEFVSMALRTFLKTANLDIGATKDALDAPDEGG